MKPRRCGKLHGYSSWHPLSHWMVKFHRPNRWSGWAVWSAQASAWGAPGHADCVKPLKEFLMKPIGPSRLKVDVSMLADVKGLEKFPRLAEFFTDPYLELDGSKVAREPGTVYIQPRGGDLQVTLKEPSQSLMMRLTVPSLASMWPTVEAALGDPSSLWEADPWARNRKPKKKK